MWILVVDDERLLLNSIERSLKLTRPNWKVRTALNGVDALALLRGTPFDMLVTDIQMPALDGMGLLAAVRRDPALSHLPLIFITGRDDRASMRLGMASGADDYLTKPFSTEELVEAIEARARRIDEPPHADPETRRLAEELERRLTTREMDVLKRVAGGFSTKEISVELGLSTSTISVHRANIMRKLDLHNAAALAALAIQAGVQ